MTDASATTAPEGLLAMHFADQANYYDALISNVSDETWLADTMAAMSRIDSHTTAVVSHLPSEVMAFHRIDRAAAQRIVEELARQQQGLRSLLSTVSHRSNQLLGTMLPHWPVGAGADIRDFTSATSRLPPAVSQPRPSTSGHDSTASEAPRSLTTFVKFSEILRRWKGLLAPHLYAAMQVQIERLLGDEDELMEEGVTPSVSSLDELLTFLSSRPWAKAPAVGLTRRGHFSASWSPARHAKADVTLTFLGDGTVKWYLYDARNSARPAKSGAGLMTRQELPEVLAAYRCEKWMVP